MAGLPISWPIIVGSLLGLRGRPALWWAYFDVAALRPSMHSPRRAGRQIQIARSGYTFPHLPMVVGIIWGLWA